MLTESVLQTRYTKEVTESDLTIIKYSNTNWRLKETTILYKVISPKSTPLIPTTSAQLERIWIEPSSLTKIGMLITPMRIINHIFKTKIQPNLTH